jgi:N utilization substance protein B
MRRQAKDSLAKIDAIMMKNLVPYNADVRDRPFIRELVEGVEQNIDKINEILTPLAPERPIKDLSAVDRAILQLATYELLWRKDKVPASVAINEAVDLAKTFGGDNSGKFINGVLGAVWREYIEEKDDKQDAEADGDQSDSAGADGGSGSISQGA